jgi:hypothetical protein
MEQGTRSNLTYRQSFRCSQFSIDTIRWINWPHQITSHTLICSDPFQYTIILFLIYLHTCICNLEMLVYHWVHTLSFTYLFTSFIICGSRGDEETSRLSLEILLQAFKVTSLGQQSSGWMPKILTGTCLVVLQYGKSCIRFLTLSVCRQKSSGWMPKILKRE